ncbi:MAG TPA: DinB family protein [Acidimicrobiales bacterium]|nr:DinB family protein [Acidimicrobiales bacterium]
MAPTATSVLSVFDHVFERLGGRLEGLGDDEYFFEPVEGCWSLRRSDDGWWRLDGGGGGGPAPDPVPVTTIAWRIGHLAGALGGFADRLFADGTLNWDAIEFPPRAADVAGFLGTHYASWRAGLAGLSETAWGDLLGPAWGPYAESNTLDLALHVLDELVHHGAEIALLRDLYAARPLS